MDNISKSSFYHVIWHTKIMAINQCTELDICLLQTVDEMNVINGGFQSKYTGQGALYCYYRSSIQALCDSEFCLLFYSVAAPGSTNVGARPTSLLWINNLMPGSFVASNFAYPISKQSGSTRFWCGALFRKKMIPSAFIFRNFLSILRYPCLFGVIARLHNFFINRREVKVKINKVYHVSAQLQLPHEPTALGYIPANAPNVINRERLLVLHDILCTHVHNGNLNKCPVCESLQNASIQNRNRIY
jgi:hypothetical protein